MYPISAAWKKHGRERAGSIPLSALRTILPSGAVRLKEMEECLKRAVLQGWPKRRAVTDLKDSHMTTLNRV